GRPTRRGGDERPRRPPPAGRVALRQVSSARTETVAEKGRKMRGGRGRRDGWRKKQAGLTRRPALPCCRPISTTLFLIATGRPAVKRPRKSVSTRRSGRRSDEYNSPRTTEHTEEVTTLL